MTDDLISQKTMVDAAVRIRTAIPQKRPVAAHLLDARQIDLCEHERLVLGGFGDHDPEGIADKRVAPEFDPCSLTTELLEADAIHRGNPAAVGDRVTALDRLPGIDLLLAVFFFLGRMPADGSRIEENVCALQRGEARRLGVPLVPAYERS